MLFQTSATSDEVNAALEAAGLEWHEVIQSAPRVALPSSHPLVNASSLSLDVLADYPYLYFDQGDAPAAFAEEAHGDVPAQSPSPARSRFAFRVDRGLERLHGDERHFGGNIRRLRLDDGSARNRREAAPSAT